MIQSSLLSYCLLLATGCCIGILLNKIVSELPKNLHAEWAKECRDFLGISEYDPTPEPSQSSTLRNRVVVLLAGLAPVLSAWQFGMNSAGLSVTILLWALIALCFIDLEAQLLPDSITLPLLWLGLLVNLTTTLTDLHSAVLGAVFGYSSLWVMFVIFKWITRKEGMGHGDFKLVAALGAWLGWQQLPMIVLLAGLSGCAVGIFVHLQNRNSEFRNSLVQIPFGPHLALASSIVLLA